MSESNVIRKPYPGPQSLALACPVSDMLYGGARGGGKGGFLQLDWIRHAEKCGGKARGLLVRKYLADLSDFIKETKAWFPKLGWVFREQDKEWVGPRGDILQLKYLENESDAERYQGFNLSWFAVDEAGQFKTSYAIDLLLATLRLPGVPEHLLRLTANPGGAGHEWLKKRYIDPSSPFKAFMSAEGIKRIFIPARLKDNPGCDTPEYRASLRAAAGGREWLVRAWLDGDWNVMSDGGVFDVEKINIGEMPILTALGHAAVVGRASIDRTVQGWDTAFTENTKNDETAGATMGKDDSNRVWLLHVEHGHWHPGDVAKRIIAQRRQWMAWKVQAEGGGAGASVEHLIRDARTAGEMINFSLVSHMKDKISKNATLAATVNNGNLWVPAGAAWWPWWKDQAQVFSGEDGNRDDGIDAAGIACREIDMMMRGRTLPKVVAEAITDPRYDLDRKRRLLANRGVPSSGPRVMFGG